MSYRFLIFDLVHDGKTQGRVMWCPVCGNGSDASDRCPHCKTPVPKEQLDGLDRAVIE